MSGAEKPTPQLSIVVPALDERDNVGPLVEEIERVIRREAGLDAELIVVDDGSTDETLRRLQALAVARPWLVVLHRDRPMGQSAALHAGFAAARAPLVATLDADLQNDPADLPPMYAIVAEGKATMAHGDRTANRRDNLVRRASTWVGRRTRALILRDSIRDTGCATKVMKVELARQLPLQFRGMHRFMGVYARLLGATVVEHPVHHRPRVAGVAKYGVMNRALVGLVDCFAVRWMGRRYRCPDVVVVPRDEE